MREILDINGAVCHNRREIKKLSDRVNLLSKIVEILLEEVLTLEDVEDNQKIKINIGE